jgi:predicted CXXCH cytochrome family protein
MRVKGLNYRLLIALATATAAMVLTAVSAYADAGPHGGFGTTSDACSGCHRAHTATAARLLKSSSSYAMCTSCHGSTAGGATTNVLDGVLMGTTTPLKGGGFVNAYMNTSLAANAAGPSTSGHKVVGLGAYASDTVWGNGALNSGAGPTLALQCYSCHNPHGKAGAAQAATYRILRQTPDVTGSTASVGTTSVADVTTKKYTINSTTGVYYGQVYPALDETNLTDNTKITALSGWCATCHTRLHATSSSASGDAIFNFRHRTDGTNVSNTAGSNAPACMTCHVAHGTKAAMGTNSLAVPKPGAAATGPMLDSSLLRIDNRGVCQSCHNK